MNILVLTPEKEIFNGAAKSVTAPGTLGKFEILENHAAMVSSLEKGDIRIVKADGSKLTLPIEKGFIEVLKNEISLLVQEVK